VFRARNWPRYHMLGMPATSTFDLRFELFRIPVRVTPWFWLGAALLSRSNDVQFVMIFVVCVFISIVIHEFGHGLMAKAFGFRSSIVLHMLFGMCESEVERQTPWQRLAVLICGPLAGFLAFGLLLGSVTLIGPGHLSPVGETIVGTLLQINLIWSIFNLFPVYPLDGGQMMKVVLQMLNRRSGGRWAHIASLVLAGLIASVLLLYVRGEFYLVILFAYFAFVNYQVLQIDYQDAKYGVDADDNWWRR
jgi:stage IV sporulation protein FB